MNDIKGPPLAEPTKLSPEKVNWLQMSLQESETKQKEAADIYTKSVQQMETKINYLEADLRLVNFNHRQLRSALAVPDVGHSLPMRFWTALLDICVTGPRPKMNPAVSGS